MDLDMMAHPATQRNIEWLKSYGNIIIEPAEGELASHLIGKGRMEEPENIFKALEDYFKSQTTCDLSGKKVLITAGPTHEMIDPVRFIGNCSTGKMGYAIAEEAAKRGADVCLVSGPVNIKASHPSIKVISVTSARQMLDACLDNFVDADIAVMAAAVADYAPAEYCDKKIKREKDEVDSIKLVKNPDIAATLGARKSVGQTLIGFALETDNEIDNAKLKIKKKNLDAVVLNTLRDAGAGFGTDTNKITFITSDGTIHPFELKSKSDVAKDIIDSIIKMKS
jgi:phosphopantothenoylcysteine decarboxylase/phosphopantothenate--cysteine ligase